jgi:signal transduction histidine kinase
LEEVESDVAATLTATGGSLTHTALPTVRGDARQLRQLFWNLVDNALKFRDPVRPPRIEVTTESATASISDAAGPMAVIEVRDNGLGFDQQHAEAVFDAFHRLHSRSQYPGTGLGLSFCRKIVEGMGGTISVTSVEGEGSVFRVQLPLAEPQ